MEVVLEVRDLKKSFGKLLVIDGWKLEVSNGESVFLFGPSGCGKTTFLRIVAGILGDFSGTVERHWKRLGFVFQEHRLVPWFTVRENLLFVKEDQEKVAEVLEMTGLLSFENMFPRQLSGGMRQRVNLARALMVSPDFLILGAKPFTALSLNTGFNLSYWYEKMASAVQPRLNFNAGFWLF